MQENQVKMLKMQFEVVKRQEVVESFCEACATLAVREREKVWHFLNRNSVPDVVQPDNQKPWTKSDMRACYRELRGISPKVANAWRPWALEFLKLEFSRLDMRFGFRLLAHSLECHLWVKYSSSGSH